MYIAVVHSRHIKEQTLTPAIEVRNVTKRFGNFLALDRFSLTVEQGSIHGFLGPNGSGKSTTIRTLLGVLAPNSGDVRILGTDPARDPFVLKRVGYVPGNVSLWPTLTGAETLRALESLRGVPTNRQRESELIDAFNLDPSKKTRDYSTGNRRKVSLIAALSFGAEVLLLDEPTAGLDPLMESVFVDEVRHEHDNGATVLLSSHILSEVEKLCDYVTVIKNGQVVEHGTIRQLRHLSTHSVSAHVSRETIDRFRLTLGEDAVSVDKHGRATLTVERDAVPDTLRALLDAGATGIETQPASLEEIFMRHYEKGE
ncbi:ABC transporter ATP-binding protein [Corynebacterium cystitidis]|uniref:ABC transporter ATP-binding protein n=1 Tax=Corynebacterium cystitidis TaxID=35757 RepID=UPI00211E7027|nr:ABC transporter ATP-binding protein [Corynebacterium cystitidis]